jgi:hypothetical protein
MTDTPPDWVLIEAAKRGAFRQATIEKMRMWHKADKIFRALCYMIQKYEQPPVDRKLLCARQARVEDYGYAPGSKQAKEIEAGKYDGLFEADFALCVRAIELWEEGFGK